MMRGKRVLAMVLAFCMVIGLGNCLVGKEKVQAAVFEDYEYEVLEDGTVEITGYNGNANILIIPSEIEGKKVSSIGNAAFSGYSNLNKVQIPEGVTSIGRTVFWGCSSLTEIQIPEGVISIGSAFSGCSSLTDVYYFGTEEQWNKIEIDSSGNETLLNANKHFKEDNPKLDFEYKILDDKTVEIIKYNGNNIDLTVPEHLDGRLVITIGMNAFDNCKGLNQVILPSSVVSIGERAFADCTDLSEIRFSAGLVSIGDSAFYNCSSLTKLDIPSGVTDIGRSAFFSCTGLTEISLPVSMNYIYNQTFQNCTSLTKMELPDVTGIGERAFAGCTSLTEIRIQGRLGHL